MRIKIFIIAVLYFNFVFGQNELIQELDKNIIEIKTLSPDSSIIDLGKLTPILNSTDIIGLGEATHGTKEFTVYKHRLIKYLVKELGYKVFIIEGESTGSRKMNDYISNGKTTLKEALFGVGSGMLMTHEFVELVEWMKQYNSEKSNEERIKFYGCDLVNIKLTAQTIKKYLSKTDNLNSDIEKGLDWLIDTKVKRKYNNDEKLLISTLISNLDEVFNDRSKKQDNEFKLIEHDKRVLEQFTEMMLVNSVERIVLRDKFMAENIEWIYHFENHQKMFFWAHNIHIVNNNNKPKQKSTGYYLNKKFKNKYYALGLGFYKGQNLTYSRKERRWIVNEFPEISIRNSSDVIFSKCFTPNFILDFKSVENNKVIKEFLNADLYQRTLGAVYYPEKKKVRNYKKIRLYESYNGLIFIRETNPINLYNQLKW